MVKNHQHRAKANNINLHMTFNKNPIENEQK